LTVCFVSHSPRGGGAERSLVETMRALRERGVECVALLPGTGWLAHELERRSFAYHVLPYKTWTAVEGGAAWRRGARSGWNLAMAVRAAAWIRRRSARIVYTNAITTGVGAFAARLAALPHVWHIRELGHEHNRMVYDLGERLSLRLVRSLSALCLANSECVAAKYRERLRPTEIRVVYQGVRLDDGSSAPDVPVAHGFRCVAVGAISPAKRQEEAIEAVARLNGRGLATELLIVGEGDRAYGERLRGLVDRLGAGACVSFLGELESAARVIRSADAVVTCSRHEAFGRVTVEGMLAGKPVVGARSAGTAELIRDGETGFLYEPGDVQQLEGILRRLIEDPAERRRVGETARAWAVKRFDERRFGDEILACLLPLDERGATAPA